MRKPFLDASQPAHPAMLHLAESDGTVKPEFQEEWPPAILDLDPGSLLPVWWPTESTEPPFRRLTYDERMLGFREQLENLLDLAVLGGVRTKSSRPFLAVTPLDKVSPQLVLRCVRMLHSVFCSDWY
jgi:hypothetical protein